MEQDHRANRHGAVAGDSYENHDRTGEDRDEAKETGDDRAEDDDDDGLFWATLVMVALVGSNLLALWCETKMNSNQSFLRGLGTLLKSSDQGSGDRANSHDKRSGDVGTQDEGAGRESDERVPNISRRRTTRIIHLKW
jgi:hypothetical protein